MLLGVNRIAMSYHDPIDAGIQAQFNKENWWRRRNPPITEFPNPIDSDDSEDEDHMRSVRSMWEFHGKKMRERNQEYIQTKAEEARKSRTEAIKTAEDAQKSRKEAIKKAEEAIKKAEEVIKKVDKAEDTATQATTLGGVLSLAKEKPEVRSALRNLTAPATATTRKLHFPRGGRSKRRTFRKKSAKKASRRSRAGKRK
jgi:hypothetical protein